MNRSTANVIDYLAIAAGRLFRSAGKPPVAMLTFRLNPGESHAPSCFLMTKAQLIRLRNDINSVLHDPEGWLFDPNDASIRGRVESSNELESYFDEPTSFESPADSVSKSD